MIPLLLQIKKMNLNPSLTGHTFEKDLSKKDECILKINQLGKESEYPNIADFRKTEGFRLPTEIEWEWFARGGEIATQDGTFNYTYSGSDNIDEVAWYDKNSDNQTHDVGIKKPNQLGLYDCTGSVWEWCYDTNTSGYISEETSYIYDTNQRKRRLRGGSWKEGFSSCNIFYRSEWNVVYYGTSGTSASSTVGGAIGGLLNLLDKDLRERLVNAIGFRIVRTI